MGSLAKRFGQISRRLWVSESASIHVASKANKSPGSLSLALDQTLKTSHDMRAFGLGTLASMASVERYQSFTLSLFHVYSALEDELDKTRTPALELWMKHRDILRRSEALYLDLKDVTPADKLADLVKSPSHGPTLDYVNDIREAGERDRAQQGGSLIGHLYCRYFADLFGGQMLALPYNVALSLPVNTPNHYRFDITDRREYIETIYQDINESGLVLSKEQNETVVNEALAAFKHNVLVYTEKPVEWDSVKGSFNICTGFVSSYARRSREKK